VEGYHQQLSKASWGGLEEREQGGNEALPTSCWMFYCCIVM
jgi:hypothetical protein